jgi:hypothetical protein
MTATALQYMIAADAAIVLDYGLTDQAVVQGLNKLSPPGFSRSEITIDEFRNEFARVFAGGGTYDAITFGGNLIANDTLGQNRMKQYAYAKTKLVGRQLLAFLDNDHFFTTDVANDPSSSMQIVSVSSGETGKDGAFPFSGKIVPNGRLAIYVGHMTEGAVPTLAFVDGDASNDTITDSAAGFVTAGFVAGQTLLILDSTSNDTIATTITTVAAGTLTLASIGEVTAEAGIEGMELHGGSL